MEENPLKIITPGGIQSTIVPSDACKQSDSGELAPTCVKIKHKYANYFATLNVNSLLKVGKLKHLLDTLSQHKILITAIQETRYIDEHAFESQGYRIFKGKVGKRVIKTIPQLGTGFIVNKKILDSITDFTSPNSRISTLSFRSTNKMYTIVNVHAPTNISNKKDPDGTNIFWEGLENILSNIPDKNIVILLGDFNAQLGKERKFQYVVGNYPAHRRTNRNGERLIELCRSFNLVMKSTAFKHLPKKQKTWKSPNSALGEFQIDHVAISRKANREIQNVKVLRSANIDSDHYLSKIKIKFIPKNTRKTPKLRINRFDTEKLKHTKEFTEKLESQNPKNWEQLQNAMVDTAKETIILTKTKKHPWWEYECDEAVKTRKLAWLKWNSQKNQSNWENFQYVRRQCSKIIRSAKRKFEKNQLLQIEQDFMKNNTRNFYQTFKRNLNKYSPPTLQLKNSDGKLTYNDKDNCQIFAKYFESLLNCEPPKNHFVYSNNLHLHPDSTPPTKEELKRIIQSLKNNKAPGEDSIIAELWKYASENALDKLTDIIEEIWQTELIPNDWTSAIIHPLFKKGDRTDVNNYRGISLLPVTYKIFSKAIQSRAEEQLDPQLGEYQGGFRKGRSCVEQILNIKSVLSYLKLRSKRFVLVFVDFKKAYDSIDRNSLIQILKELGLDNKTRALIKQTLTNTTSKVKFRGETSEYFEIKTGVRQGDGLSPLLFNCVLEKVIREWREEMKTGVRLGCKNNNLTVDCLAFADDLAIFADSLETAKDQINILIKQAAKSGLHISFEKTEFLTNIKSAPKELRLDQGVIKRVDKFKYLGEWILPNLSEKEAFTARFRKMETAFQLTRKIYNKRCLSKNVKLKHYKTVIQPEILYAAECLTTSRKGLLEKLETKERNIIRKILGPVKEGNEYRRRHNQDIYDHIEKVTDTIRKRRITMYGHIARMAPTRLTHRIFKYFHNKKCKGQWLAEVEMDMKEIGLTYDDTKERGSFRDKIRSFEGFRLRPKLKTGKTWTEERKEQHRQRMKEHWVKVKEKRRLKRS